ncbi:hypothetical protein Agub_g13378 [Astrephomene gubernaculifera]|uniref:Protein kinase domain-containing protein n=1 Tax=Astrephomene gubernaculifera TaxID=47775 RepID=A0AAD3DZQ0_9CHLO|nr:hypothetical protein Agub_g13378 [Astrephomene gubernaculifera]
MVVLVQEFAVRGDLYGMQRALRQRLSERQLVDLVVAPLLSGLSYLHGRGVCHRDIKPENLLFTHDWRLVVGDFGASINVTQERAVTRAGTLEYMAPEVERCPLKVLPGDNKDKQELAYTTAVDVWAVGVLAYELLVGFPPVVTPDAAVTAAAAEVAASPQGPGEAALALAAAARALAHSRSRIQRNDPDAAGDAAIAPTAADATAAAQAFLAANASCKTLSFPASTSAAARDFISMALAERPEERPTAQQLAGHVWLRPFPPPTPQPHQQQPSSPPQQQPSPPQQ